MRRIRQLFRLIHINFILARHGLDNVILSLRLFAPLRFLVILNPWNWFRKKEFNHAVAMRHALQELGPIFVKFGQALSTRRDLIPHEFANELAQLQDNVPPFSGKTARQIIETELGQPIESIFIEFDEEPFASASIAQVHAARFRSGKEVIVKVLRPRMREIIRRDLDLLYILAGLAQKYLPHGYRLRPYEVVEEFEKSLIDELDLTREAANCSQLRRNFQGSKELYIPEIFWEQTKEKILVQERIYGMPIYDTSTLREHGVNFKRLAERGVTVFFTQVFRDCFFHADMHPGNFFVSYDNPSDPTLIAVDFGIVASLTENDKRYLAANFLAFFKRDYRQVAQLHIDSGWIPKDTRVDELEGSIRAVCEPIFERPLKDISMGQLMLRLLETGRRFKMELQPQLVMLQKTLFSIEGLGRQLYPELDLWNTARPFLEKWVKEQMGPMGIAKRLYKSNPYWLEDISEIPMLLHDVLKYTKRQHIREEVANYSARKPTPLTHKRRRWFGYGVGSAFMLTALIHSVETKTSILNNLSSHTVTVTLAAVGIGVLMLSWLGEK